MNGALQSLILLYPRAWRDRYESEFRALLDDVSPTWRTLFDVFGGALKMQMKIWSPWKLVAAFAIVGVLGSAAFTLTIPERYVSTAVINASEEGLIASIQKVESRSSLVQLIVQENLYPSERAHIPIEDVIEQMKQKDINIRLIGGQAFAVSFSSADAGQAQRTTQWLASRLVDGSSGTVVDPAKLPVVPVSPRLSKNLVMGLIAGIVLGSLLALFAGLKVWKLAAGLGVAGAIAGAAIGYVLPERFGSAAVVLCVGTDQAAARDRVQQISQAVTSEGSLSAMVQKFNLYANEAGRERRLREHLQISVTAKGRPAILIKFDDRDRYMAQKVTGAVVSRFMEETVLRGGRVGWDGTLELLDPPSLPLNAYFPNRPMAVGSGLFIGLAAAIGLGLWRLREGVQTA
jgi:outer membrane lipoprotein SlyB